ncbi:MAG: response regulator transcription factor [Bacteroidales bacterium]|jgi:DNA-binding NarL/FixJ family response regulator|nr:response regulator transcription factor [Bacteroidales bacterium]
MAPIQIVLVEDDDEIRDSIELFLSKPEDFRIVGSYGSAEEFIEAFEESHINVVLMDINLPGMNGIECVRIMKPQNESVQYLMCTVHEDQDKTFEALCAGATGYILKNATPAQLVEAVRDIARGGSPMSPQIARYVLKEFQLQHQNLDLLQNFTQREKELVIALSKGFQYKEIADQMLISLETVRTYVRKIYEKLQVHSRTDAINKVFGQNY